jgi:putative transcriptional regulator
MVATSHCLLLLLATLCTIRPLWALVAIPFSQTCTTTTSSCSTARSGYSLLQMSKNADRARIDRLLEESMGDDWRLFRAQLVAQETAQAQQQQQQQRNSKSYPSLPNDPNDGDELTKQGQLGDIFGAAIHSIFHSSGDGTSNTNTNTKSNKKELFAGAHRAAAAASTPPTQDEYFSDPFASPDELPIWQKSTIPKISKHRWAHPIAHIEPGCVLVAHEKLGGVFHQTIVLIVDHHETAGSTGIVINRCVQVT